MKNQKGFVPVIIILIVLIGFVGVYYLGTLKPKAVAVNPTPTSSPESLKNYSIELLNDWKIDQYGIISKNFDPTAEESLQCGKKGMVQILVRTSDNFRENLWSKYFTKDTFYDLTNKSWSGFFKSGGGGTIKDTNEIVKIGNEQAVKFTRVWIDAMECWPNTETHYFILNPNQNSSNLLVTQIEFEIQDSYAQNSKIKSEIDQILSTFKFTN